MEKKFNCILFNKIATANISSNLLTIFIQIAFLTFIETLNKQALHILQHIFLFFLFNVGNFYNAFEVLLFVTNSLKGESGALLVW